MNTYSYVENDPVNYIDPLGQARRRNIPLDSLADLLDSSLCDWWPASCIFTCIRWRCSEEGECGETRYYYIGSGNPYSSNPGYDPNDDENCECVDQRINTN